MNHTAGQNNINTNISAGDMAAVSQQNHFSSQSQHSYGSNFEQTNSNSQSKPHVFSDDELSEIFQIDFGQIFGNPDSGRQNNYKGIQLKKSASQGNLECSESSSNTEFFLLTTHNLVQLFFLGEFIDLLLHLLLTLVSYSVLILVFV